MSSSSFASNGGTPLGSSSSTRDGNNNFTNGENMLKLALKKPKAWKWELTTSSSAAGIDFPKIQLFDSRTGELMVQVDKPDCCVKSEELVENGGSSERSRSSQEQKRGKDQRYRRSKSSCIKEKVVPSGEYLSDVFEQLQSKGMGYKLATSVSQYRVQDEEAEDHSLQKSKSANEINGKKKNRKSSSSRSSSILGRISEFYKSSTEEESVPVPPAPPTPPPPIPEITVVEEPPPTPQPEPPKNKIYKLVRSNAGTLIVREESFHTQRSLRRRKLESSSSIPEDEPHAEQRVNLADIPTSSYDTTINEIDKLISKVMLSHTLQSVEEPPKHCSPVRIKEHHEKKRRSRRSASAGSSTRSASGSRRRRNSPRVTVLPGTSSEEEDAISLAESRFGSLKRRGRPKYRRNNTAAVPAEEERKEQESNATHQRRSSVQIAECSSTLSSLKAFSRSISSTGTARSQSKSSSTSVSTLSPPSDTGDTPTLPTMESIRTPEPANETHQAAIATLPEVHFERLNSIEQTAQVTEILNPKTTRYDRPNYARMISEPSTRSRLNPDNFFNSYLAELRSVAGSASQPNQLATSQSTSSLANRQPKPTQQRQYGRRHHRSSFQLMP